MFKNLKEIHKRFDAVDILKHEEYSVLTHINGLKKKYKKHFAAGKAKIGKATKIKLKSTRLKIMAYKIQANSWYGSYFPISENGTSIFFCNTKN